jgi:hypothetical protein
VHAARVCPFLLVALVSCGAAPGGAADSGGEPAAPVDPSRKFVAVKILTPDIIDASERWLKEVYNSPVGTEQRVVVTGRPLLFILQWHYHPPGFVGAPTGKHKGVTVFEEQPESTASAERLSPSSGTRSP